MGFTRVVRDYCAQAAVLRRFHAVGTVVWTVMIPVTVATPLKSSLPFLTGISVYALAIGHFASWQGARAEVAAEAD